MAAGRLNLMLQEIEKAKAYFTTAATLSPRTQVQKELGWISLEEGHLPNAISMLTDHIQRNSSDYEAYNLFLKCFVLSERYEAGVTLAQTLIEEKAPNDCFRSNQILCCLLSDNSALDESKKTDKENPFVAHNLKVATEMPRAWNERGKPALKSKLVFEEYRHGIAIRSGRENVLEIVNEKGKRGEWRGPMLTVGSASANNIALKDESASRRHAAIINFPDYVWIYDLGSARGISVDGRKVSGRMFLDGVHEVRIGRTSFQVAAKSDLLL
jgi:hypothetical protein